MNPQYDESLGVEYYDDVVAQENQSEQRTPFQKFQRTGARALQRGTEALAGLPGDVVQLIKGVSGALPGGVTPEEDLNILQRGARRAVEALPTSASMRERAREEKPELEPESRFEAITDEVVSDFATLAIPVKGKIPFARSLGLSMVGNLGKEAVKDLGVSERGQEATKIGLMLFSGMFGKGRGVNKHINNLYKESETLVPEGANFRYPTNKLSNVEKIAKKGALTESKVPTLKLIEEIKAKSPSGIMTVEEAIQFDKDINKQIMRAGADKTKKGLLKQLKGAHTEALNTYAKENPAWAAKFKEAKQAYAGIAQSEKLQNFIKRNANLSNFAHGSLMLGLQELAIPGKAGAKLATVGGTASILYAAEIAKRLVTNPALRKYYGNVVKASLSENKAALIKNLAGLEREAKKELEKNPIDIETIELED